MEHKHKRGVYRTKDDLKNFIIRVELCKISAGGSERRTLRMPVNPEPLDGETVIFRWQEKVFSQLEEEVFADALNCTSPLEMRYHRDILRIRSEGGRPNNKLFSYTEGDRAPSPAVASQQLLTQPTQNCQTFTTKFGSVVRRRAGKRRGITNENPIIERPSVDQRIAHRIITPPCQSMYIMADLHMPNSVESEEYILCHIQVDSNGMVSVQPDFNDGKAPYKIETLGREIYEYSLEHGSQPASAEEKASEKRIHSELYQRHSSHLQDCVGSEFTDPPDGDALGVLLLGEIVSAQGFEYDDLYVTAHLELPDVWEISEGQDLSVVTQISRTKSKYLYNIAHFNCPFEYNLTYLNLEESPKWPRVVVEVASLDWWDRHRVEGYGHVPLPTTAGMYEFSVETWRPIGRKMVDRLRCFFVGGTSELSDISYVTQPSDFEGTHLSKYGFQTESSGVVNLQFNIAHHSNIIAQRYQSNQTDQTMKRHKEVRSSLANTLDAFHRARQRAALVTATLH